MADLKLQASRALAVVPSDTIDIPQPSSKVASGASTTISAGNLQDNNATFQTIGVKVGDIVHEVTTGAIATVDAVTSETVLDISADIFLLGSESYNIYRSATRDTVIYVGVTGNVVVETSGGDVETFVGVPAGMILPVNIKRVNATSTTATNIIALW